MRFHFNALLRTNFRCGRMLYSWTEQRARLFGMPAFLPCLLFFLSGSLLSSRTFSLSGKRPSKLTQRKEEMQNVPYSFPSL